MLFVKLFKSTNTPILQRGFANAAHAEAETTALYDFHVAHGGKIVNFGGFLLPVQYNDLSIVASHLHTRTKASIFDVSHMLQTEIKGKGCLTCLESVCTADLHGLKENSSVLTVFTNDKGGILDDLIITKINEEHLYVVSNAAMKKQDQHILSKALEIHKRKNADSDIKLQFFEPKDRGLIALQGPKSSRALQNLTNVNLESLYFMTSTLADVTGVKNCRITRCGYTGEDGFEISMPAKDQVNIVEGLLKQDEVKMAGLGARDSLRLEAGLCLYGSDITSEVTPVDAGLVWLVSKKRREARNFPGVDIILNQIKNGSTMKRVGIIADFGPPARHGAKILDDAGKELGEVTSGCPSPSLGKHIAMGYVSTSHSKIGTKVILEIRNKSYNATIAKMPFVNAQYYNKPK